MFGDRTAVADSVEVVIGVYLTVECARGVREERGEYERMFELSAMMRGPAAEVVTRAIFFRDGFKVFGGFPNAD